MSSYKPTQKSYQVSQTRISSYKLTQKSYQKTEFRATYQLKNHIDKQNFELQMN